MEPIKAARLNGGTIDDDERTITLHFDTENGGTADIEMTPPALEEAFQAISGLLNNALERFPNGKATMHVVRPMGFRATSPTDPGYIIWTFALTQHLEHHYSIPLEFLDRVYSELRRAAAQNRRLQPLTPE